MFEGLKVSATWVDTDRKWGLADVWRVTISRNGKRMQVPFTQGSAYKGKPPTAETVLESLVSDASCAQEDFEDFCSNFGYDVDSREAYKTWKACQSINERLPKILTADEWEKVGEGDSDTMEALRAIPTKNN